MRRFSTLILAVVLSVLPLAAQAGTGELDYGRQARLLPSNGEIYGWIKDLWRIGRSSDIGFRQAGTDADHAAAHYLAAQLEDFGLSDVRLEPVEFTLWTPHYAALEVEVGGTPVEMPVGYMPYTRSTPPEGTVGELLYVGRGMDPAAFAGAAGKIVVVDLWAPGLPYDTVFAPFELFTYDPDGTLPGAKVTQNWPVHNHVSPTLIAYNLARLHGAAGFIGILDFDLGDADSYYAPYDGIVKDLPGLYLSRSRGAYLRTLLSAGPATATMRLQATVSPGITYNVVATHPGHGDEAILVTSHHDGWAVNDGSGTAVVLALAKYFGQQPPLDRTLVFLLAAGHFIGDIPTRAFIEEHRDMLDSVVVNLNVEHIAAEVVEVDGQFVKSGLVAPRAFFISGPPFGGNPYLTTFAKEAVEKYELERTIGIPAHGPLGAHPPGVSQWYHAEGIPILHFISGPAVMFSPHDTPNKVAVGQLRPVTAAFVDIIEEVDVTDAALLR